MSDIVERLRYAAAGPAYQRPLFIEAADVIEQLRALLRESSEHFERGQPILWARIEEALRDVPADPK